MPKVETRILKSPVLKVTFEHITITYDTLSHTTYFRVSDAKVARTKEVATNLLADFDSGGRLVGLEMLGPGKMRIEHRRALQGLARRHGLPALRNLRPDIIPELAHSLAGSA